VNNYGGFYAYNSGLDASQKPDDQEGIGNRHGKGAAILAFDTHVRWISLSEFDGEAKLNPGLLYCTPR
jgi:outer membrane protease